MSLAEVGGESGNLTPPGLSELQRHKTQFSDPHNRHGGHRRHLLIQKQSENCDPTTEKRSCHGRMHPFWQNNCQVLVGFDMASKPALAANDRRHQGRTKIAGSIQSLIAAKTTATDPAQATNLPDHA